MKHLLSVFLSFSWYARGTATLGGPTGDRPTMIHSRPALSGVTNSAPYGVYSLYEQQCTHYNAALFAYHNNDPDRAIRVFEYLAKDIKPDSSRYKYVVCNLALLYHEKHHFAKAIQWAEIGTRFQETNYVSGFLLASLLYLKGKSELYNSFMAYRSIKITNYVSLLPDQTRLGVGAIIDYNMAIILYKLGAVGAADVHFEDAIEKLSKAGLEDKIGHFRRVKAAQGIDFSIDTSPMQHFRLFTSSGELEGLPTKPLLPTYPVSEAESRYRTPRTNRRPPTTNDNDEHILAYYFHARTEKEDKHHGFTNDAASVPLPSPHQLSNHYDHHEDYFSHRPRVQPPNQILRQIVPPSIVLTPPPPIAQSRRPTLTRGITTPVIRTMPLTLSEIKRK